MAANKSNGISGDVRHLINDAVQTELANLAATLNDVKEPIDKLNFLAKLLPYVCSPIKPLASRGARIELGEEEEF